MRDSEEDVESSNDERCVDSMCNLSNENKRLRKIFKEEQQTISDSIGYSSSPKQNSSLSSFVPICGTLLFLMIGCEQTKEGSISNAAESCTGVACVDRIGPLWPVGASANNTGNPIGGGSGYSHIYSPSDTHPTCVVDTLIDLQTALEDSVCDIVYIEDNVVLNFDDTKTKTILIPSGKTVASGRGNDQGSLGALIFANAINKQRRQPIFLAEGHNIRITGLRLRGPFTDECDASLVSGSEGSCPPGRSGILVKSYGGADISNCEIWGWPDSAIEFRGNSTANYVHHNYIHHNRRDRKGYGISLRVTSVNRGTNDAPGYHIIEDDTQVLIEANSFDHNRHDVAATGGKNQRYTARFNISYEYSVDQHYDIHGSFDWELNMNKKNPCTQEGNLGNFAGRYVRVFNNTVLDSIQQIVVVRGVPEEHWSVKNNKFAVRESLALCQKYVNSNTKCSNDAISPAGNCPGPNGEYNVTTSTDGVGLERSGNINPPASDMEGWYVSWGGVEDWAPINASSDLLSEFAFHDFNGDGRTDVFHADGSNWKVSNNANHQWRMIKASDTLLSDLGFGDFNCDGVTDMIRIANGGASWKVAYSNKIEKKWFWTNWREVTAPNPDTNDIKQFLFADFDGNGCTDIFRHDPVNNYWEVAFTEDSGNNNDMTPWRRVRDSRTIVANLTAGNFDDNESADLFHENGEWYIAYGPTGSVPCDIHKHYYNGGCEIKKFQGPVNSSLHSFSSFAFGDFNGDGITDVFRGADGEWKYSKCGQIHPGGYLRCNDWEHLNASSWKTKDLVFGDFNGDGIQDIMRNKYHH